MSVFLLMTMCFAYCSGITAFAAVDLDVTIIPPADTVQNGKNFDVELEIATKSANGYVELVINIEYDADLLALYAPVNQDGYKVTGSKGQLRLTYFDPTGTNTPTAIGDAPHIPITFTVMANAPDTTTKIKASIDHAYNSRGKNVTWTPIYDKEIEIIRINEGTSSEEVSSEEESSQFVVGTNTGDITRSSAGAGTGGKIASVVLGAVVVFVAGMAAGYILCMRKYEGLEPASKPQSKPKRSRSYDDDYDDYYDDDEYRSKPKSRPARQQPQDDDDGDYDNDDGFYTKPTETRSARNDDDFLFGSTEPSGSNYLDAFAATPMGSRRMGNLSSDDFSRIIDGSSKLSDMTDDNDDDYPILFMTRDGSDKGSGSARRGAVPQTSPTFDEEEDTIFGKFTGNVDRNTDDGYGGLSSGNRRRDRSERSRRNR